LILKKLLLEFTTVIVGADLLDLASLKEKV
jgi:hypothetical protein